MAGGKADVNSATKSKLYIALQTDKNGGETSWTIHSVDPATDAAISLIASVGENTYQPYEEDSIELYLAPGKYRFTLKDSFGDGFCCSHGKGWFSISVNDRELIRGGWYKNRVSHDIVAGYDWVSEMSERDKEWLEAHNTRRKTWHEQNGETFIPLYYSQELAKDARSWAEELLDECKIPGIVHESGVSDGENLAKNLGSGDSTWGGLYPAENVSIGFFIKSCLLFFTLHLN